MPEIVGYCRVSTDGQSLEAQIDELKRAGATMLSAEKQSGARADRPPQLRRAIDAVAAGAVRPGDYLGGTRIYRLASPARDPLNPQPTVTERGPPSSRWATPGSTPRPRWGSSCLPSLAASRR